MPAKSAPARKRARPRRPSAAGLPAALAALEVSTPCAKAAKADTWCLSDASTACSSEEECSLASPPRTGKKSDGAAERTRTGGTARPLTITATSEEAAGRGRSARRPLCIDTSTSNEEATERYRVANTSVLESGAPRSPRQLPAFRAQWAKAARGLRFPAPLDPAALVAACKGLERVPPTMDEFTGKFFGRHGAYYVQR